MKFEGKYYIVYVSIFGVNHLFINEKMNKMFKYINPLRSNSDSWSPFELMP